MDESTQTELLAFFKALSDANRLKIVALLAKEPLPVEKLAEKLGLTSPTVSHHLAKLSKAGLVSARAVGYYSIYQLELQALSDMSQRLLSKEVLPAAAGKAEEVSDYDRKVLKTYLTPEGRIQAFPVQEKKELAILRHVANAFEFGRRYTEKEVKKILLQFSEDTARLRRNLIEYGFMDREGGGGEYWRVEKP